MIGESALQLGANPVMFGILHTPETDHAPGIAFVFLNAGLIHRPGPFRLYVELARRLQDAGFTSVRIDQTGKGDSERRPGLGVIEAADADVQVVADYFASAGQPRQLVLIGLCSGADDSFWIADTRSDIKGMIAFDGYCGKTPKFHSIALARKARRVTPRRLLRKLASVFGGRPNGMAGGAPAGKTDELADLRNFPPDGAGAAHFHRQFEKQMQLLYVFTGDVSDYYNHPGQLHAYVEDPRADTLLRECFLPHARHTYPFPTHREEVADIVIKWCIDTFDR